MTASTPTPETIVRLRLAEVHPAADNVRADVGDVTELAASIANVGVVEPLIVVPAGKNGDGYTVVVGHRRLAGAKLAGVPSVPAIIRELEERDRIEIMLVENLQRADLTPLEEAEAYRRLIALGIGQAKLAERIGRSQAHVSKRLSLLKLPGAARTALGAGALPLADALELVPFQPAVVEEVLKRIPNERWHTYPGQIKRAAEQIHGELEGAKLREAALAKLTAAKISILKTDQYGHVAGHPTQLGRGYQELPMRQAEHSVLGCHAAAVDNMGQVRYFCTKPETHLKDPNKEVAKAARQITEYAGGRSGRGTSEKLAKAAQKKAAATRERNKVLRVAEPIRRKLARTLLKPSKVRREAVDFAIRQLIQIALDNKPELGRIAAELLDVKAKDRDGNPSFKSFVTGPARVDQLAYALGIAAGEAPFAQLAARSYFPEEYSSQAARYFAHLKAANYKATPTELEQIKPSSWRGPFDK